MLGAPQLQELTIHLPDGKDFTIKTRGWSEENRHVASVTLNGQPLEGPVLTHAQILQGGTLTFTMTR